MSLRPPLAALALSLGIGAPAAARVPPRHHPPSTRPPAHPASPARSKSHAAHPPSSASPRVVDLPSEIPPTAAPETPAPVEEARPSRRWPYALPLPIAGVAALAVWLRRRRREEKVVAVAHAAARARGVAELQGHDPDFDPPAFLARAHRTIEAVRAAWAAGSMAPARRLVSDGVFVRFQSRIELLRGEGLRHVVLADSVDELELLAAESDRSWDSVHVKVVGERRAADVPLSLEPRAARRAARTAEPVEVQEVWSFVRRRGLRSRGGAPALDGQCPSCGGAIPDGAPPGTADVRCRYCKAVWNSGEHDWVLLDVTPPEEWLVDPTEQEIPGLRELRSRDPRLSRQELEDRAVVVFWKWLLARATGDRGRLARLCTGGLESGDDGHLQLARGRWHGVDVIGVELLGVEPDGTEEADGWDRAMVEVRWSHSIPTASTTSHPAEPGAPEETLETLAHVFVLARSSDAVSARGLSSLDCPGCGAPLADAESVQCRQCGEPLRGGRHDWALESVAAKEVPDSAAWRVPA